MKLSASLSLLLLSAVSNSLIVGSAEAQEAWTSGEALSVPVFDSIDENGVDLTTGMLRIRSPQLTLGSGDEQISFGFEWTGRSWRMLGVPMINKDNGHYFVTYNGVTEEFDSRSDGFAQLKPITGSTLDCLIATQDDTAANCMYVNRYGDVIMFKGIYAFSQLSQHYGMEVMALGNMGMGLAEVTSGARPNSLDPNTGSFAIKFGENNTIGSGFDANYDAQIRYVYFGTQRLKITTPNHDGTNSSEHYLRPVSTTQSFEDDFGAIWQYTVNGSREITKVQPPNGLAATNYTYNGDHRVLTVTNPAGTWNYAYSSANGYRTVTVTAPSGRIYSVKSHIDNGYVVEHREAVGQASPRITTYQYDAGHRLRWVTYPELNKVELQYDARGNVTYKKLHPKSGSTDPILTWQAGGYYTTCTERVLCNRPAYIIDPMGNRTEFQYAPHATTTAWRRSHTNSQAVTVDYGHGKPVVTREFAPASQGGALLRTTTNTYWYGRLDSTSICITATASCAGTTDEVKTEYGFAHVDVDADFDGRGLSSGWGNIMSNLMVIPASVKVTSGGTSHLTCYDIDDNGRVVGETLPNANMTSCVNTAGTTAPAYNASIPENGNSKTAPTFSQ